MINIKYNSQSKKHKHPFGAVSNKQEVRFSVNIVSDEEITGVDFIYRRDNSDTPIYISMQKKEEYDNNYTFFCHNTFNIPDLYFYRFEIKTNNGILFVGLKDGNAVIEDWLPEWQITVYDDNFKTPDWVYGGIMYQIFPDRFCRDDAFAPLPAKGPRRMHKSWYDIPEFIYDNPEYKANDYYGGNIDGIISRLDYIKSLGVNIIYLNPVFESPEYHRYSTADYMNIDPYFGTNEGFERLAKKCAELNIKIIIDGVFSHTGADSIYFNKYNHYDSIGAFNSVDSKYHNWYSFTEYPDKYECWWGFENLPNVVETNKEYMDYITGKNGVIEFWQRKGCNGWRLDVADELPDEFLDSLYKRAKTVDRESFVVGEVWEDATNKFAYGNRRRYLLGGQMDSVMNYPWRTAILEYVKSSDEKLFNDRLVCILENYPPQVLKCLMNSISTHDTLRAITYFGVNHDVEDEKKGEYKMTPEEYDYGKKCLIFATFLQFTLPGIPSIYYGDEVGLQGFRDPYCRMGYPYGYEDKEILEFYRELARVRTENKTDFSSDFELYSMSDGMYSFKRGELLCAINLGNEEQCINYNAEKTLLNYGCSVTEDEKIYIKPQSFLIVK